MKKLVLLSVVFLSLFVLSCSTSDPRHEVLRNHVETTWIDGTRLDLDIKVLEFIDIGEITGKDSVDYLVKYFEDLYDSNASLVKPNAFMSIATIDSTISILQKVSLFYELEKSDYKAIMKGIIYSTERNMIISSEELIYRLNDIKHYKGIENVVLGKLVRVKFTMYNPFFKVNQEMDRTYLFSVTGDKVIKLVNSGCDFVRYKTSW